MSSPFQRKFSSKNPLKRVDEDGNNELSAAEGYQFAKDRVQAVQDTPLMKHKSIRRKINKARKEFDGPSGDFEELHADLYAQETAAKKAHTTNRTEEEDAQVREDEDAAQGSAIEMQSPLHGYAEGTDVAGDQYVPTGHLWTNMFDKIAAGASAIGEATLNKKKKEEMAKWLKDPKNSAYGVDSSQYLAKYTEVYGTPPPKTD
tara:strand:+ start:6259 stop:6867 length:609 start_codon:yes stop_codon:yes gene_type:complete